jgi:hypothetical protein
MCITRSRVKADHPSSSADDTTDISTIRVVTKCSFCTQLRYNVYNCSVKTDVAFAFDGLVEIYRFTAYIIFQR